MADIKALVDSGATDNFIHPNFVKRMRLGQRELDKPKNIYNINDTTNKSGQITHYLSLAVTTAGKTQEMRFLITDIGREDVLLGYPWLSTYEPRFSWRHGTIDESNLPVILQTINPSERRDVVVSVPLHRRTSRHHRGIGTRRRRGTTHLVLLWLELLVFSDC
jgi:hypothetical protein